MKQFIGWLADFYPNHFFYAAKFADDCDFSVFNRVTDDPHETDAATGMLAVAIAAGQNITEVGGTWTGEFTNVTNGGNQIGSFKVTVEKTT